MAALVRNGCPWLCSVHASTSSQLCSYTRHTAISQSAIRRMSLIVAAACSRTKTYTAQPPQHLSRSLHTTGAQRSDLAKRNHYERLQVAPTATRSEIKKSFYRLSKAHHPDANRQDPNATHTFSLLSESYSLLSDPSRRSIYDRDVMGPVLHAQSHRGAPQHGSYHSSHSAGGRAASGLSKRRGTFRGPPPSFYRSGGWGEQAEKRRRAHEESTSYSSTEYRERGGAGHRREDGNGDDAFTRQQTPGGRFARDEDDVPLHFDKESHRRTHENEDRRRWARERKRRRALDDEDMEFEPQTSLGAHFAIMLGILGATVLVPVVYLGVLNGRKREPDSSGRRN